MPLDLTLGECGNCREFLDRWQRFWDEHSQEKVAVMVCDGYYDGLRKKSQAMVRQANRRYRFQEFRIEDDLCEVEAVNLSKTDTSYGPTYGWLAQEVTISGIPDRLPGCAIHRDYWYGGWDTSGVLRGYLRLVRMGRLGVVHTLFSHHDNSTGVQNGLLAHTADHADVDYVSYHTMDAASHTGRPAFKRHTGFTETEVRVA